MEAKALERSIRDERAELLHVCHKGLQIRTLGNIVTENQVRKPGSLPHSLLAFLREREDLPEICRPVCKEELKHIIQPIPPDTLP